MRKTGRCPRSPALLPSLVTANGRGEKERGRKKQKEETEEVEKEEVSLSLPITMMQTREDKVKLFTRDMAERCALEIQPRRLSTRHCLTDSFTLRV